MEKKKEQKTFHHEKGSIILEPDNSLYYIIERTDYYEVDSTLETCSYEANERLIQHVNSLLDKLTIEEQKFLLHECVTDAKELTEKMCEAGYFKEITTFRSQVKNMSSERVRELCLAIKFTKSFNCYLCYMLSDDWKMSFDSEEERLAFRF